MTIYYSRADGTQTDKALAKVGGAADAALSMGGVNGESFSAGDVILFESGTYTEQLTIPSGGSSIAPIKYQGVSGFFSIIDVSANAADAFGILCNSKDYVQINNLAIRGSGGNGAVRVTGTSGANGDGYNVVLNNLKVLSNYGASDLTNNHDGLSFDGTSEVIVNSPDVRSCREDPPSNGSHQAFAPHGTVKVVVNDAVVEDCNWACVAVQDSQITFNRGVLNCGLLGSFDLGANATADCFIKTNSTVLNVSGSAKPPFGSSTTSTAALVELTGGQLNTVGTGATTNNRNRLRFVGVALDINQSSHRYYTFGVGARIDVEGGTGVYRDCNAYNFREEPGGQVNIVGHRVTGLLGAGNMLCYFANTTAGTGHGRITGNVIEEFGTATQVFWIGATNVAPPDICNNLFQNTSGAGEAIDNDMASNGPVCHNNVFVNCQNSISDPNASADIDYNCYYNSSWEGGANSVDTDPGLDSDFIAQNLVDSGSRWWVNAQNPIGFDGEPFADWSTTMGAVQSRAVPFHPTNIT